MKKISLFSVLLALILTGCKKTDIETPLQVTSVVNYYPQNYGIASISKRSLVFYTNGSILGITIDSTNKQNAFVYGNFSIANSQAANGIIKFQTLTRTTVAYPISISSAKVNTFCQYNGLHYFGGSWLNNATSTTWNFGYKNPNANTLTCPILLNGEVNAMQVKGNDLYFAGSFDFCSSFIDDVSPMLYYSNGALKTFANANYAGINCMAFYNSNFYAASPAAIGGMINSTGTNWFDISGGGFDYSPNELTVFNNTLYAAGKMTQNLYGNPLGFVNFLNNTGQWHTLGSNSLPNECLDLEYHNGILYACGINYLYYYNATYGTWNNYLTNSFTVGTLSKICFINNKLYAVENGNSLVMLE